MVEPAWTIGEVFDWRLRLDLMKSPTGRGKRRARVVAMGKVATSPPGQITIVVVHKRGGGGGGGGE